MNQQNAIKTAMSRGPAQGPMSLPYLFDFTSVGSLSGDFLTTEMLGAIEFMQNIYIDNSQNAASFSISFDGTGQTIWAQPYTQGIYPILAGAFFRWTATTSAGIKIPVLFNNVPMPFAVWGPVPGVTVTPPLANGVVNFAPSAAGDNILIPAAVGKTTKLYRMLVTVDAPTSFTFKDGAGTSLSGPLALYAGGSIMLQAGGIPWFTGSSNTDFIVNTSAAVNLAGVVGYVQS